VNNNKLKLLVDSMALNHHQAWDVGLEEEEAEAKSQDLKP
jgi:hypothetical protein